MQETTTFPATPSGAGPERGRIEATKVESGLGAWATAISADDNAQAAIALAEAINRARATQANRESRTADARVIAVSRLETLRARLAPVYAAIPRDVELFDLGMVGHNPPRLFVDIIAFVEMSPDERGFRLMQETRTGRVLLGETADERQMTGLVTNYIAERLVERERALAAQGMHLKPAAMPKASAPIPPAVSEPAKTLKASAEPQEKATAVAAAADGLAASPAAPAFSAPAASPAESPSPAARPLSAPVQTPAQPPAPRANGSGGWVWPVLALIVGIGLGALALYLYAASLARP